MGGGDGTNTNTLLDWVGGTDLLWAGAFVGLLLAFLRYRREIGIAVGERWFAPILFVFCSAQAIAYLAHIADRALGSLTAPRAVLDTIAVGSAVSLALVMLPALRHLAELARIRERVQFGLQHERDSAWATSQTKSEYLAMVAHEIRSPLNGVIGFSELLFDGRAGALNPDQSRFAQLILDSGRHLLSLVNNLVDIAQVETGNMQLNREPVDVLPMLIAGVASLAALAAAKTQVVTLEVDPLLGTVLADPVRLLQIVINYLSNAIKYTPAGGLICVRANLDSSEHWCLAVTDSGPGISAEDQARLFTEFARLRHEGVPVEGTGLGLALCKRIVEAKGGRVWITSEIGAGSTFGATLPLRRPG